MAEESFVTKTLDKMLDIIEVELKLPLGIAEVKMSPTEIAKEWRENEKKRNELADAIKRAEEKFIEANPDNRVAQMLHELPLYAEDDFKKVVAELLTHLNEKEISWLVEVKLTKIWGSITNIEEIRNALRLYIPYLRHELSTIEEFREAVSSLRLERIEEGVERVDQRTEKIDKTTERIEDKLDEALKPKRPKPVTLNTGWFLGHQYGDIDTFTGRDEERKMLTDWLNNDKERLLIIRALGGFGKSALTWEWLNNDVDNEKWKTVIWWSFYETGRGFDSFLSESLKNLGIPTEGKQPRQQINELLAAMQKTNILLVLDGFERLLRQYANDGMNAIYASGTEKETDDIDPSQRACVSLDVDNFLRGLSSEKIKSKILMTTRLTPLVLEGKNRKLLKGFREEKLIEFKPEDAVKYFRNEDINATRVEIIEVSTRYGFHPLSLNLLVGLINEDHNNSGDIIVANQLEIFDDIKANKHHVLERAYDSLLPERKELLSKISCFRGSIEYNTIKKLFDYPDLEKSLKDLRKRGLLKYTDKTRRYDMHPIVRHYAYDRFTDSERKKTHMNLAFHFIDAMPVTNKNVKTLEDLTPVIELYHHMVGAGNLDEAMDLLYKRLTPNPLYFQFGAYQLCIELLRALFLDGEDKPPRLKTDDGQAWTLNMLSSCYALNGQPSHGIPLLEMNLVIREKQGRKDSIAIVRGNLANRYSVIGALGAAERNHRRAIDLCNEIDDETNGARRHSELIQLLSYRGKWDKAEQDFSSAIQIFEKQNAFQGQSVTWAHRALRFLLMARDEATFDTRKSNNEYRQSAIECAKRAFELAEGGDPNIGGAVVPRDLVRSRWMLGSAYRMNNELTLAEENLSKALNLCRQINAVDAEADILLDVARLRYALGDFKDAQEKAEEALIITERSGYVLQGADVNLFLAQYALEQEKDKVKAKEYAEKAKELAYCDGGEYKYKVAYDEAERSLENL